MFPTPYSLPNIFTLPSDRSVLDLKNQYSIVNRLNSKNVLANFSFELDNKLPLINKRLKVISEKENSLTEREKRMAGEKQLIAFLEKDVQDLRKLLLTKSNHCCCRCTLFLNPAYPPIIPINPYQQQQHMCHMGMPFMDMQNMQNGNRPQRYSENNNREPRKSNQNGSQNKLNESKNKNSKKKAKTFRKFVIAVYFFIFLKYYSAKFTKNRYQFFKQRYLSNEGEKVKEDSYKITKTLESIDLINIAAQANDSITDQVSTLSLTDVSKVNFKKISQIVPSKIEKQFEKALNFINLYIKEVQEIVLSEKFLDFYGEIIGIGTINQSFYMDDLMIPQQIQFITFSQKKGFAQISPETQKILIMIYVFVKHILFKILLKLKDRKYLESKLKDNYAKFQDEKEEIYEFFELVTAIFYSLVNTIYLEFLQNAPKTNYDKLKKRFKISPAKVLTAPHCPKSLKENLNYEELIAGVPKISDITEFLEDEKYDDYLGYLVEQVEGLAEKVLESVKEINRAVYDELKPQTLDQKFLIFQGMKNEKNPQPTANTMKKEPSKGNNSFLNPTNVLLTPNSRVSDTSLMAAINPKSFKKAKN